ncbi:MAG: acyl-[Prevotella sp.]|nr:acyl-[acyl-carrier-protein] thioesterase [Prevotella sp.]
MDKIGRYEFLAEPFHCDFSQKLFMSHLGNHLLNAADFHSNDRGFGMHYLNTINKTWVLSRLAVEMTEMPRSYDRFTVETWVESAMRFFTNRNFKIYAAATPSPASGEEEVGQSGEASGKSANEAGEQAEGPAEKVYGYGRSVWAMIDTETRQPVDLFSINNGAMHDYIVAEKPCPIEKSSRVKMPAEAALARTIDTCYSDVDINGHINSIKYIEHVLDLWDIDWYSRHSLRRFEIAYVAEAHLGDKLLFYVEKDKESVLPAFFVRIAKLTDDGTEPIETCRSKVVFEPLG